MPLTLAVLLLLAAPPQGDPQDATGNEPTPMVLVVGGGEVVKRFLPLDEAIFGEDGKRQLDYEFEKGASPAKAGLVRRKIRPEEDDAPDGQAIPLGLKGPVAGGAPCIVLEMVPGQPRIEKNVGFALRLREVEPEKLRDAFGPGVFEGDAFLSFSSRDDALKGKRSHLVRLRLVIPGRRAARPALTGTLAVGQKLAVRAAVEEIFAGDAREARPTPAGDRLRVEIVPEGEAATTLDLPWPVAVGAFDPRDLGPKRERADWAVPPAWLDEPILVGDPGSTDEATVSGGAAHTIVHRQSLTLPPLFAPGTMKAQLAPAGVAPATSAEVRVRSGLRAGPALAFVGEAIMLRAAVSREGAGGEPPDTIKVRVDRPDGKATTHELKRDGRAIGYASYEIKAADAAKRPIASIPGYYKITPNTGIPALDAALGGQIVVFAALERDDGPLRDRERVAFLSTTPIHWPLIVSLASGQKDGAMHRADTLRALTLRSVRGPEEIAGLSVALSQISSTGRQPPHDNEKDGEIHFKGPGKAPTPQSRWVFDRKGIALDLGIDIDGPVKRMPLPPKGSRDRVARFVVAGVGPDKAMIGRIFSERFSYTVASHWDYYLEWSWLPGLILMATLLWWYIRRKGAGTRKVAKARTASSPSPSAKGRSAGTGYLDNPWAEPEAAPPKPASPEPPRRELPGDPGPPSGGGGRYFG